MHAPATKEKKRVSDQWWVVGESLNKWRYIDRYREIIPPLYCALRSFLPKLGLRVCNGFRERGDGVKAVVDFRYSKSYLQDVPMLYSRRVRLLIAVLCALTLGFSGMLTTASAQPPGGPEGYIVSWASTVRPATTLWCGCGGQGVDPQ